MTGEEARIACLDWLAHERRAASLTVEAYGSDIAGFLGFLTQHLSESAGQATILRAIGVASPLDVTIASAVRPNGPLSSPGRGDVSWQAVFTSQGLSPSARP